MLDADSLALLRDLFEQSLGCSSIVLSLSAQMMMLMMMMMLLMTVLEVTVLMAIAIVMFDVVRHHESPNVMPMMTVFVFALGSS